VTPAASKYCSPTPLTWALASMAPKRATAVVCTVGVTAAT